MTAYLSGSAADRADERIWCVQLEDGIWSKPKLAPFTYDCFEYKAFFYHDGSTVFLFSQDILLFLSQR